MTAKVQVVIGVPMTAEYVERIRGFDPRVTVDFDPSFFPAERTLGDHHGGVTASLPEGEADRFYDYLAKGEVVYGIPQLRPSGLRRLVEADPDLRWVHAVQAGAGPFLSGAKLTDDQLERVTVTTSAGVHAEPLAEFAIFGMLAGSQDLARLKRLQAAREWPGRLLTDQLSKATVVIVGAGEIGKAVAVRAKAMGMTTIGVKRRVESVDGFDEIVSSEDLKDVVGRADHLVVTAPGTPSTNKMVNAEVLAACKPGVVVVNVGRGTVIDEAALIAALESGQVSSAALDVFEKEPLPTDSPLWGMHNVIVSPHSATLDDGEEGRVVDLFLENLRNYLDGAALRNIIDPAQGY
ncbi:D-2-hydroxyacid dehydrogenase [Cumulibacter soli]|uniref:D-2-hydroxyacid dehydrogenase n=1 Tax=Cumulibacter soli TaxID=2546344 RepID=UPI001067B800|nr:D-2-hydroxyacid dehydrogenase [Cumulibacter soli]